MAEDHVVWLDYGQFYLTWETDLPFDEDELPGSGLAVDLAIDADGIAQVTGMIVVLSPHQNNFAMPLRVEAWDSPPPDDTPQWPEAFEAHLDVPDDGLSYSSPTVDTVSLGVPAGRYHLLVTGRGFVAHGWPGSTKPGDDWRIRLWPSDGPPAPRRLSAWRAPEPYGELS